MRQNKQLMEQNDLFRQEIERLKKILDNSGTNVATDELGKPPPTASTITPADGMASLVSAMRSTAKTPKRELTHDLDTALVGLKCK